MVLSTRVGALAETEEDKILAQRQSVRQEVKTDTNSTLIYMSTLIESKDISTESSTKDNMSELDENISKLGAFK